MPEPSNRRGASPHAAAVAALEERVAAVAGDVAEIKADLRPIGRAVTEAEAQVATQRDSTERAFGELKALREALETPLSDLSRRLQEVEHLLERVRGGARTISWIWGAFGLAVLAAVVTWANTTHADLASMRERLTVVERATDRANLK